MALTTKQKNEIQKVISNCLRNKFNNYVPQDNYMPFHTRLLKDRWVISFIISLTTFGTYLNPLQPFTKNKV